MKKILMASVLAVGSWAGAAQAAPVISVPASLNLVNLGTGNGGGFQNATPIVTAAGTVTFTGSTTGVYSGNSPSLNPTSGYASPFGSSNRNYFAVQPGGSITFTLTAAQTMFGALIGTIDSYNSISFTGTSGTQTFSGTEIATALGLATNGTASSNVLFTGLNSFNTVTFNDANFSAFEFVPGSAVPEPAAWGMMILGFGLVGGVLRRRPSVKVRFA